MYLLECAFSPVPHNSLLEGQDSWYCCSCASDVWTLHSHHIICGVRQRQYTLRNIVCDGSQAIIPNLVPRPPPRFYLAAVEKSRGKLHSCEIKSGWRPGYEVNHSYMASTCRYRRRLAKVDLWSSRSLNEWYSREK